jgi:hypothetical protein
MTSPVHRLGLAVAAIAAVLTIGGFFVADGYLSAQQTASTPTAATTTTATTAPDIAVASPAPQVVYVRPAPSPRVIHVTRTSAPAPAPRQVIHVTVPSAGGDGGGDGSGDGGGND